MKHTIGKDSMSLKGFRIDFGYTLAYIDEEEDAKYRKGLVSVLKKHGYNRSLDELSPLLDSAYRNSTRGEMKSVFEFWKLFLKSMDISQEPILIKELVECRERYLGKTIKLYDNAIPILSVLRRRYKLALVSNCAIGLSDVIRKLGLNHFFECIILSCEVGVRKPDTRIYLEALQRLKLESEECVFVADEISDLEGARKVGLKTFLVKQGPHTFHEAKDLDFKYASDL